MYPFTPGSYAPRNGWYVAAFVREIGEALLSRWILNQPVVLYRKEDGTAVAVDGRCPHRHYPLGASKRVGDAIQCGYHGITFDAAGKCTFVPSQSTIPGVYAIKTFQDENSDGEMNFDWFGIPTERFGFSNDAKPTFQQPSFDSAKFILQPGANEMTIHLRWLF